MKPRPLTNQKETSQHPFRWPKVRIIVGLVAVSLSYQNCSQVDFAKTAASSQDLSPAAAGEPTADPTAALEPTPAEPNPVEPMPTDPPVKKPPKTVRHCLTRNTMANDFRDCCSGTLIYWQSGHRDYCFWRGQDSSGGGQFDATRIGSTACILPPPENGITANQWVCR